MCFRFLLLGFGDGIEVAGTIRVLDEVDRGRGEKQFIDMYVPADDIHEVIAGAHLRGGDKWLSAVWVDFDIVENDFLKGANGRVGDGNIGVDGIANAGQND